MSIQKSDDIIFSRLNEINTELAKLGHNIILTLHDVNFYDIRKEFRLTKEYANTFLKVITNGTIEPEILTKCKTIDVCPDNYVIESKTYSFIFMPTIKHKLSEKNTITDLDVFKIKELFIRLWTNGIKHGDISIDNILYDEDMRYYIIDFEYSEYINNITDEMKVKITNEVRDISVTHINGLILKLNHYEETL